MNQTLGQRATLTSYTHRPIPQHRPVPTRLAIVLVACVIVPVLVLVVEMVRSWI